MTTGATPDSTTVVRLGRCLSAGGQGTMTPLRRSTKPSPMPDAPAPGEDRSPPAAKADAFEEEGFRTPPRRLRAPLLLPAKSRLRSKRLRFDATRTWRRSKGRFIIISRTASSSNARSPTSRRSTKRTCKTSSTTTSSSSFWAIPFSALSSANCSLRPSRLPGRPPLKMKAHLVSATHIVRGGPDSLPSVDYLLLGRGEERSGGQIETRPARRCPRSHHRRDLSRRRHRRSPRFHLNHVMAGLRTIRTRTLPDSRLQKRAPGMAQAHETARSRDTPSSKSADPSTPKHFWSKYASVREWTGQAEGLSKKSAGQKAAPKIWSS